jgi:hypothetical protein
MFGFNTGLVPYQVVGHKDYRLMHRGGAGVQRLVVAWVGLQPSDGPIDWSSMDADIASAASSYVRTVPVLTATPRWVTGCKVPSDKYCYSIPPVWTVKARRAWKTFVHAMVARYGPNGQFWSEHPELPRRPIHAWEIWNEPNLAGFFTPAPSPTQYAHLLKITATAVHTADPSARLVLGGLATGAKGGNMPALEFVRKLTAIPGVNHNLDVISIHPYMGTIGQIRPVVGRMGHFVRRLPGHHGYWVTELGWSSEGPDGKLKRGPGGQARLVQRTFNLFVDKKRPWGLTRVFYFTWKDGIYCHPGCWGNAAGLRYQDSRPKPAWHRFHQLMRQNG